MCSCNVLNIYRRQTIADVIAIGNGYCLDYGGIQTVVVDMQWLDRKKHHCFLLGVFLTIRRFYDVKFPIVIKNAPDYLPLILRVGKLQSQFLLADSQRL